MQYTLWLCGWVNGWKELVGYVRAKPGRLLLSDEEGLKRKGKHTQQGTNMVMRLRALFDCCCVSRSLPVWQHAPRELAVLAEQAMAQPQTTRWAWT